MPSFEVGAAVEARFSGDEYFFRGVVVAVNADGTGLILVAAFIFYSL